MFLDGLNEVDRKILELLIGNARLSYSEIGERVGLSRVAVKTRIQGMEKKGIIEMYTAVINPQKISGAVSCYFDIETEPAALEDVVRRLCGNSAVTQIYRMTGNCRLHVHAVAPGQEEMERLIRDEMDVLPGVTKLESHVIFSRIKDVKGLRL